MPPRRGNMGQLPGAVVKHVPIRQVEKRARSFEMEDEPELYSTKDKSRKVRSKVRYLKQGHQKSQSISPLDKQVEPEEPMANYRNTSIQALCTLFSKCYADTNVNDNRSITEPEKKRLRNLAEDIERAILAQHGDFTDPNHPTREYGNQIRTLRYNVANNQSLQTRIIMGELSPTAVARLTPEEMLTKTARDEQHDKEARACDLLRWDRNLAPQVEEELAAREQSGVVCSVCGLEKVALVHRYNALEDEQQRKMEMACNACGTAVVRIG